MQELADTLPSQLRPSHSGTMQRVEVICSILDMVAVDATRSLVLVLMVPTQIVIAAPVPHL